MNDKIEPLNENERNLLGHLTMFGSAAYPIRKSGRGWVWFEFFGVKGAPVIYKTKREATEAFEAFVSTLRERKAAEAQEQAINDRALVIANRIAARYDVRDMGQDAFLEALQGAFRAGFKIAEAAYRAAH